MAFNWDPHQYQLFLTERTKPAIDLLHAVTDLPVSILDMGCGTGNSTALLQQRFPEASIIGVDQSVTMIDRAKSNLPSVTFVMGDMTTYQPINPVDLLFSNAALQWAPQPLLLMQQWGSYLAKNGQLAIQFPINFDAPTHQLIAPILAELDCPPVQQRLGDNLPTISDILSSLSQQGLTHIQTWDTTYYHHFSRPMDIVNWMMGTGLRPALAALADNTRPIFLERYTTAIESSYPQQDWGVLFPFTRRFLVAKKGS